MKLKRCDFITSVKMIGDSQLVYSVCSTREGRAWCDIEFDGTTVSVRYSKEHLERINSQAEGINDTLFVPVTNVKCYTLEPEAEKPKTVAKAKPEAKAAS